MRAKLHVASLLPLGAVEAWWFIWHRYSARFPRACTAHFWARGGLTFHDGFAILFVHARFYAAVLDTRDGNEL